MQNKPHTGENTGRRGRFGFLITGITISLFGAIVVAILPSFFSQDRSLSLIVALVGVALTLLFDMYLKLFGEEDSLKTEMENNKKAILAAVKDEENIIVDAITLGEELVSDSKLRDIIEDIVADCEKTKKVNSTFFVKRLEVTLNECHKVIRGLAQGEQEVEGSFGFRTTGVKYAKSSMQFVQYADPSYFSEPLGKNYLKLQREAIQKNVNITRIWLQPKAIFNDAVFQSIIKSHVNAGIDTLIVEREKLKAESIYLCKDYGIIDSELLVSTNSSSQSEHISINKYNVDRAIDEFKELRDFAQSAREYYNWNTQDLQK